MNYRIATEEDLGELSELGWDFCAEDGYELPVS
jgi:hypothetical protein